jgi:hypothetical protein
MTYPIDYNQHLLAYLQAWRQLLEASAAMTTAIPISPAPSGMPPMPPMPFIPPMAPAGAPPPGASPPTDYAQQLFGYLQAWRQYLEQAIGAAPGTSTQPTTTQPTGSQPPTTQSTGSQSAGSQSTGSQTTGSTGSQSSFGTEKPPIVVPPRDPYGSIGREILSGLQDLLNRPEIRGFASPEPRSGSAFAGKTTPPASVSSAQAATRSLFSSGRAAGTPSATEMQTGRDPRLTAPPATSRWWEAGQGLRPGFKDKPDEKNIVNIRPLYLGGAQ